MTWTTFPADTSASMALRKRMNSWWRCGCMQLPTAVPSRTSSAANSVVVVARLGGELRVVRELEAANAVRLQPVRAPDAPDRVGADADRLSHWVGRPMRRLPGRLGQGQRHHPLRRLRRQWRDARWPGLVPQQAVDPGSHESLARERERPKTLKVAKGPKLGQHAGPGGAPSEQ